MTAAAAAQEPAASSAAPPLADSASAAAAAWDAAIGLTGAFRPSYPGSPRKTFKATPAFYFSIGRFTITNASGFAPRRSEDVVRGLGIELLERQHLRLSLSLRYDGGRAENSSPAYQGLGNIRSTLRARVAASWQFDGPWRLGASWNADMLGHGDGGVGDVSLAWEHRLTPDTLFTLTGYVAMGDTQYMQAYYGVTAAQAVHSVYPVYRAAGGLRDTGLSAGLRHDIGRDWTALAGAGMTRLMGSAASSPLTTSRNGWSLSAGLARHF